ncbi:hypothetical protein KGO06_02080 [Patescibacteria group bacterium]|nr:hypothetical protein [Patescibacteria group bacterium]
MGKQFICDGTKYELAGVHDDVIGLPVTPPEIPDSLVVEGATLTRRPAFHVSLVCIGKLIERHSIADPTFVQSVVADFCAFVQDTEIAFERYTGELRFVVEGERKTLAAMCDVSGLHKFFDQLRAKHSIPFDYPPTHVTVYTLGGGPGIFLVTQEDIRVLTRDVYMPSLSAALSRID